MCDDLNAKLEQEKSYHQQIDQTHIEPIRPIVYDFGRTNDRWPKYYGQYCETTIMS